MQAATFAEVHKEEYNAHCVLGSYLYAVYLHLSNTLTI